MKMARFENRRDQVLLSFHPKALVCQEQQSKVWPLERRIGSRIPKQAVRFRDWMLWWAAVDPVLLVMKMADIQVKTNMPLSQTVAPYCCSACEKLAASECLDIKFSNHKRWLCQGKRKE